MNLPAEEFIIAAYSKLAADAGRIGGI